MDNQNTLENAGSHRYSFGIGRYIGSADKGKALSVLVSAGKKT